MKSPAEIAGAIFGNLILVGLAVLIVWGWVELIGAIT